MTTRSQVNSNFYQIVAINNDGNPTEVLPEYVANANVNFANSANTSNVANSALALDATINDVTISGGLPNYILQTDGSGNLTWVPQTGGGGGNGSQIANDNSNVTIPVSNGNVYINVNSNGIASFTNNEILLNRDTNVSEGNLFVISNGSGSPGGIIGIVDYGNSSNSSDVDFFSAQARGTRDNPLILEVGDRLFNLDTVGFSGNGVFTIDGVSGWTGAGSIISSYITDLPLTNNGKYSTDVRLQAFSNTEDVAEAGLLGNGTFYITGTTGDGNLTVGNVSASGNINANFYFGDGGYLSNIGGGNVFDDITVNNSILLDGINLSNNGSNVFIAQVNVPGSNVNVATNTALVELFNFDTNTVQNDLGNVALVTNGSDWVLSNTQTKYNNYSWYIISGGNNNYFRSDYNYNPLNSSNNYTIDMWVYLDSAGSGQGNQTLINGNGYGFGTNYIWFAVDNANPTNGNLILRPNNGTNYTIGTFTGSGWYHIGFMRSNGILYGLFNGTISAISGNPTVNFPNSYLEFLGSSGPGNAFKLGYACNMRTSPNYALFVDNGGTGTYTLPVSTDYDPTGNITIVTPAYTINALDYNYIANTPPTPDQLLNTTDSVTFYSVTATGSMTTNGSMSANGTIAAYGGGGVISNKFWGFTGGTNFQMDNNGARLNLDNNDLFTITGTPGTSGIIFPDSTTQITAFNDIANNWTVTNVLNVGNVQIQNTGNTLSATYNTYANTTVATGTALTELFNFDTTTVQNDLGNVSLTTYGSNWSLSNTQTKYNNYSWYNIIGSSGSNYFDGDYNVNPLNSSSNWTIDMWIYADSGGSGSAFQTFVNGSGYGSGPNNIWLGVDNGVPTNGTVCFYPNGYGNTRFNIGTMSGSGWYHLGLVKYDGILYSLFNGSINAVAGNPSVSFPNNVLQFLGGNRGNDFAIGYACNMRISPNYALFNNIAGNTYTLPTSTDYDPVGSILIVNGQIINNNAYPPSISIQTNDTSNLANITGVVGSVVAVTDGDGKLAYWDTLNTRWSYVFDNSAI